MAFLGIRIQPKITDILKKIDVPGDKTDTSDMHITILCFEDNISIKDIAKSVEATYDVIKDFPQFKIKTNKVSCFPKRKDNPCPIIMPVVSEQLHELHKRLCKSFDEHNIDYSKTFKEYHPHITLSYADKEIKDFKSDLIEQDINEIILWGGNEGINEKELYVNFPLQEKHKHAVLINQIELFYKLAKHTHI